jgi:hypothetical protein
LSDLLHWHLLRSAWKHLLPWLLRLLNTRVLDGAWLVAGILGKTGLSHLSRLLLLLLELAGLQGRIRSSVVGSDTSWVCWRWDLLHDVSRLILDCLGAVSMRDVVNNLLADDFGSPILCSHQWLNIGGRIQLRASG